MSTDIIDLMHSDLIRNKFTDALEALQLEFIGYGECKGYTSTQVADAIYASMARIVGIYIVYAACGDEAQMERNKQVVAHMICEGMLGASSALHDAENK